MCRRSTNSCVYHLNFQYNNFKNVFSIVKKRLLFENFSIPCCKKYFFPQCSTSLVGMRFCRYVSNSPRDKNIILHNPCLLENVAFLASKTLLPPIGTGRNNFFINFEIYDLANGEERVYMI
jgi:NADH:ubiquinone oxidoreductase subunit B-like Fe-S oxidoreductase